MNKRGFTLIEVMAAVILISFVVTFLLIRRQEISTEADLIKYRRESSLISLRQLADIEYAYYIEKKTDFSNLLEIEETYKAYTVTVNDQTEETFFIQDPLMDQETERTIVITEYVITLPNDDEYKFSFFGPLSETQ
ncbi:MAG: type II secretion system protein [Planctomycetes bacterium]|nr:type II secretion system protein [Planctomycetota bacterium]